MIEHSTPDQSFTAVERRVATLIECRLAGAGSGGFPRFAEATVSMLRGCIEVADFVIEIAPGITMLADLLPPLEDYQVAGNESRVAVRVCDHAMRASSVAAEIASEYGSVTRSAASLVADANGRGVPVKLVSVHLAEFGFWVEPDDAQFVVTIEAQGQNLQVRHMPMTIGNEEALERLFETAVEKLARRAAARKRLNDVDADGMIDRLSLNEIRRIGKVEPVLHSMMRCEGMGLKGNLELRWEDGAIYSVTDGPGGVNWTGTVLTVDNFVLPATACVNAVGRPITDLVPHAALTSDILIQSVTSHEGEGLNFISVCLDVPDLYFNVTTGEVWPVR